MGVLCDWGPVGGAMVSSVIAGSGLRWCLSLSLSLCVSVLQLQQQGILKSDDLITRFFRISIEMCVDLCYRTLGDPVRPSHTHTHTPSLLFPFLYTLSPLSSLPDHQRHHGTCQVLPHDGRLCEAGGGAGALLRRPLQHHHKGQPAQQGTSIVRKIRWFWLALFRGKWPL